MGNNTPKLHVPEIEQLRQPNKAKDKEIEQLKEDKEYLDRVGLDAKERLERLFKENKKLKAINAENVKLKELLETLKSGNMCSVLGDELIDEVLNKK